MGKVGLLVLWVSLRNARAFAVWLDGQQADMTGGYDLVWRSLMKVGDLVRYRQDTYEQWIEAGIVVRCIAGTDELKVILWSTGTKGCHCVRDLEIVSESR